MICEHQGSKPHPEMHTWLQRVVSHSLSFHSTSPLFILLLPILFFSFFFIVGLDVLIFQSPKSRRTGENQVEGGVSIIQRGPGDRSLCPSPWHMASLDSSSPTPHDQRVIPESAASLSTPKAYSEVHVCTDFFPCALLEGGAAVAQ